MKLLYRAWDGIAASTILHCSPPPGDLLDGDRVVRPQGWESFQGMVPGQAPSLISPCVFSKAKIYLSQGPGCKGAGGREGGHEGNEARPGRKVMESSPLIFPVPDGLGWTGGVWPDTLPGQAGTLKQLLVSAPWLSCFVTFPNDCTPGGLHFHPLWSQEGNSPQQPVHRVLGDWWLC